MAEPTNTGKTSSKGTLVDIKEIDYIFHGLKRDFKQKSIQKKGYRDFVRFTPANPLEESILLAAMYVVKMRGGKIKKTFFRKTSLIAIEEINELLEKTREDLDKRTYSGSQIFKFTPETVLEKELMKAILSMRKIVGKGRSICWDEEKKNWKEEYSRC